MGKMKAHDRQHLLNAAFRITDLAQKADRDDQPKIAKQLNHEADAIMMAVRCMDKNNLFEKKSEEPKKVEDG